MRYFFLLFILASICSAQDNKTDSYYECNKAWHYGLGDCFEHEELKFTATKSCIEFKNEDIRWDPENSSNLIFQTKVVSSRRELYEEATRSIKMSVSSCFGSASGGIQEFDQMQFSEDSLVWIMKAENNFGWQKIKKYDLKEEAKDYIKKVGNWKKFTELYGNEFILAEEKGALILVIYNFKKFHSEKKEELKKDFNVKGAWGEIKGNLQDVMKKAEEISKVEISIYAIAGPGITGIAKIIGNTNISVVHDTMEQYVKDINRNNASTLTCLGKSLKPLYNQIAQNIVPPSLSTLEHDNLLKEMFFHYKEAEARTQHLGEILRNKPDQEIKKQYEEYFAILIRIKEDANQYIEGNLKSWKPPVLPAIAIFCDRCAGKNFLVCTHCLGSTKKIIEKTKTVPKFKTCNTCKGDGTTICERCKGSGNVQHMGMPGQRVGQCLESVMNVTMVNVIVIHVKPKVKLR